VAFELSDAPGAAFGLEEKEDPGEAPVGAAADPGGDSRGSVPRPGAQDAGSTGGTCNQTDISTCLCQILLELTTGTMQCTVVAPNIEPR
jgi:hypothetical protein